MRSTMRPEWSGRGNSVRYQMDWRPSRAESWRGTSIGFQPALRPTVNPSASPSPSGTQTASHALSSRAPAERCGIGKNKQSLIFCSHICAVGRRADESGPPDRRREILDLGTVYQSKHAAAETGAHDASAEAAGDAPCLFDERVDGWCRDFEIIAEALVRLLQQPPDLVKVAPPQRINERVHARDLRVDVAPALRVESLCLAPPLVVGSVCQRAVLS